MLDFKVREAIDREEAAEKEEKKEKKEKDQAAAPAAKVRFCTENDGFRNRNDDLILMNDDFICRLSLRRSSCR